MWLFKIDEVHTFFKLTMESIKYQTPCELYKNNQN